MLDKIKNVFYRQNKKQNPENISDWIQNLKKSDDSMISNLGYDFEYIMNHLEEYENGEIKTEDLPNTDGIDSYMVLFGISMGSEIQATRSSVYEFVDGDEFVGYTLGYNDNMMSRARKNNNISVKEVPVENGKEKTIKDEIEHINKEMGDLAAKQVEDVYDWCIEVLEENKDLESLENINEIKKILAYSSFFGINWEQKIPTVYVIHNKDKGVVEAKYSKLDKKYNDNYNIDFVRDIGNNNSTNSSYI
jgi:flagellin-specific chaperone FliS